jgi:MoaA/NifB/PqqE/SkfB family radical SAM enzyme
VNSLIIGRKRQNKIREENDCNLPWIILLDPTSACNLHCTGCWAAEYGNKLNMEFELLDNIIEQGKELGIYTYLFSGGEPLVRKKDIIKLCEKHNDCAFLSFTNGTLIDESFAEEMLRVKNFVPAISVEGFAEATDSRRGRGTYQAVVRAMEILKEKKLGFGISCCYTRQNVEVIGSEEFIDEMINRGAKFAWLFTYMPIGVDAVPELMVTAEQRKFMYEQIRKFRGTKPIFTMDFWNDGEFAGGCVAGGRCYLHINANGDIEPCAFIHYYDSNIREKTIFEALKSPLFMEYYHNQPFNNNHLRPCPLLDNPDCLVNMVAKSGAKSTDLRNPEDVNSLADKCRKASIEWAFVADKLWDERK